MGELPEPWNTAAEQAGIRQTFRGIGEAAGGVSHVTVKRLITGDRTSPSTINKVAEALGVDRETIHNWLGLPVPEWGFWELPDEAQQLNPRARAALTELILAVTQGGQHEDLANSPAEKKGGTTGAGDNVRLLNPKHQQIVGDAQEFDEAAYGDPVDPDVDAAGEESQDDGSNEPS